MKTKKRIGAALAAVGLSLLTAGLGNEAQAKDKGRGHAKGHDNGKHLGWDKGQHKGDHKGWSKNSKRDSRDWRKSDWNRKSSTNWRSSDWRKTNTRNTQWRLIDTDYYRTRSRAQKAASIARQRGYRANASYDPRRQRWVVREYRRY